MADFKKCTRKISLKSSEIREKSPENGSFPLQKFAFQKRAPQAAGPAAL
jgi:hypothetical protein